MHMDMSQELLYADIYRQTKSKPNPHRTFCASLRSRNAHGHVTSAILCKSKPDHRRTFCTTLRSRNSHGHVTRSILCRNFLVKGRRPEQTKLARQTLCEPEQSKCTWTSHKSNFRLISYENLPEKTRETKANTSIKHRHQPLP